MEYLLAAALAYLIGAIPTGALLGRFFGHVDLTQVGSGSTGATNVSRTLGMRFGVLVQMLDLGKGALPPFLAIQLGAAPAAVALAAVVPVIGHTRSIFLKGRGGRGVMAGLGGMAVATTGVFMLAAMTGCIVAAASRYISLGSICGAIMALLAGAVGYLTGLTSLETSLVGVGIGVLVVLAHKDNAMRLRAGTERRIGEHITVLQTDER